MVGRNKEETESVAQSVGGLAVVADVSRVILIINVGSQNIHVLKSYNIILINFKITHKNTRVKIIIIVTIIIIIIITKTSFYFCRARMCKWCFSE